jgi:hypothetical protein
VLQKKERSKGTPIPLSTLYGHWGRNFSVLRYEPVLKIDPYQRRAWNSLPRKLSVDFKARPPVDDLSWLKFQPLEKFKKWRNKHKGNLSYPDPDIEIVHCNKKRRSANFLEDLLSESMSMASTFFLSQKFDMINSILLGTRARAVNFFFFLMPAGSEAVADARSALTMQLRITDICSMCIQ